MARKAINLGTAPNGAGGDTYRGALVKAEANFVELYTMAEGAVIARGTNAYGEYTRWADGTQMCWVRFRGYTAGQRTGAWPIAFASFPGVSGSIQPSTALDYQWMAWGTLSDWGFWPANSADNIVTITGVGRWK